MTRIVRSAVIALSLIAGWTCATPYAAADMVVSLVSVTPSGSPFTGDYRWNYQMTASPTDNLSGAYFTIYDVAGIVSVEPALHWGAGTANVGKTPAGTMPTDDSAIQNVTFSFNGSQPGATFYFTIIDTYSNQASGQYAWSDSTPYPVATSSLSGVGNVDIPSAAAPATVPEPASFFLLTSGFAMLGLRRRKRSA